MKVFVAPASARTATAAVRSLLSRSDPSLIVKGLYRDTSKVPQDLAANPRFESVRGNVTDADSLDFAGVDVVVTITPPGVEDGNIVKFAENLSQNVKNAVEKSGSVKRLVLLSSVGAHLAEGVGEIKTNNAAERIFSGTNVSEIIYVRAAFFMENWLMILDTLKAPEPFYYSTITPIDYSIPHISAVDVGRVLADESLTDEVPSQGKIKVFELHGPRDRSPLDVQAAFSKGLGKDVAIKAVEPKDLLAFYCEAFPEEVAKEWVEMSTSFLPGGIALKYPPKEEESRVVRGTTELEDVLVDAVKGFS